MQLVVSVSQLLTIRNIVKKVGVLRVIFEVSLGKGFFFFLGVSVDPSVRVILLAFETLFGTSLPEVRLLMVSVRHIPYVSRVSV